MKTCRARGVLYNNVFTLLKGHTHKPNIKELKEQSFKRDLCRAVSTNQCEKYKKSTTQFVYSEYISFFNFHYLLRRRRSCFFLNYISKNKKCLLLYMLSEGKLLFYFYFIEKENIFILIIY